MTLQIENPVAPAGADRVRKMICLAAIDSENKPKNLAFWDHTLTLDPRSFELISAWAKFIAARAKVKKSQNIRDDRALRKARAEWLELFAPKMKGSNVVPFYRFVFHSIKTSKAEDAWAEYLALWTKAQKSCDINDGIAAGEAWAIFYHLLTSESAG